MTQIFTSEKTAVKQLCFIPHSVLPVMNKTVKHVVVYFIFFFKQESLKQSNGHKPQQSKHSII